MGRLSSSGRTSVRPPPVLRSPTGSPVTCSTNDASATVKTTGHPLVALAPAALAVANEVSSSGPALVEAIIVGFEVVSRVGRSAGGDAGHHHTAGFQGSSVFGVFGATAASARLPGLNRQRADCVQDRRLGG
jgi:MmgE/PrpD N-terminal domain